MAYRLRALTALGGDMGVVSAPTAASMVSRCCLLCDPGISRQFSARELYPQPVSLSKISVAHNKTQEDVQVSTVYNRVT